MAKEHNFAQYAMEFLAPAEKADFVKLFECLNYLKEGSRSAQAVGPWVKPRSLMLACCLISASNLMLASSLMLLCRRSDLQVGLQ